MSQATLQRFESTGTEQSIQERKQALYWTPNNPDRGGATRPDMHGEVVAAYYKRPGELPYQNPCPGSEGVARSKHRTYYRLTHQFDRFTCPDCDRHVSEVKGVDVHHKDRNPKNGDPENLIALCRRCHGARHGDGITVSGLTVEEWGQELMDPGSVVLDL